MNVTKTHKLLTIISLANTRPQMSKVLDAFYEKNVPQEIIATALRKYFTLPEEGRFRPQKDLPLANYKPPRDME